MSILEIILVVVVIILWAGVFSMGQMITSLDNRVDDLEERLNESRRPNSFS